MKALGWILVVGGFLWLSSAPLLNSANIVAAWSDLLSDVDYRRSLEPEGLRQQIDAMRAKLERDQPWVFTPACMMLCGAVLLSWTTR
jgi:hypothetical protein